MYGQLFAEEIYYLNLVVKMNKKDSFSAMKKR